MSATDQPIYPHPKSLAPWERDFEFGPLYLKSREIDRRPLDGKHRGEARVISQFRTIELESSVGTFDPE
jgi:hypothetical protein